MKRFKNKTLKEQVIVITGASSGIGLATAKMANRLGAKVVLSSRNKVDLDRVVKTFRQQGGDCIAVVADVSQLKAVEKLRDETLAHYGRIDTWVNNAGVSIFGHLMDGILEEERQLFETNFWGVRHGSRVAVPELAKSGGVLINVGSEVSMRSVPLQGMYSASKHAVKAYTDALRMELEKDHVPVSVCLIRPAGIDTPFTEHAVNELREGAPSLPPPVYHPDVVAQAILDCALQPQRDVFIGAPSKVAAILEVVAPRVLDHFMEASLFKQQSRGSLIPHTKENEGLMHAPKLERRITGGHNGRVLKSSAQTRKDLSPVLPWALLGLGLAYFGLRKTFSENPVNR